MQTPTRQLTFAAFVACVVTLGSCNGAVRANEEDVQQERIYLIGQDLEAIRGYLESDCCVRPDGGTAYIGLYAVLNPEANFGGIGVDADLDPVESEQGWGAGPVSAWKTQEIVGGDYLAIGLDLAAEPYRGAIRDIPDGKFDAEIDHLGKFIQATDKTVLLRIGYEFDGAWNAAYADRANYRATWRYLVDRLRAADVTNVKYVWQGAASPIDDIIDGGYEDIEKWYPGDSYVDWVGTSWFLMPDRIPPAVAEGGYRIPKTLRSLTDEIVEFAEEREKPVMVAELSPQGFDLLEGNRRNISYLWDGPIAEGEIKMDNTQIWMAWFRPFFDYVDENESIVAVAYINADWDAQPMWSAPYENGYWGDSRLQTNPAIAQAWNQRIENWRGQTPEQE